MIEYLIVNAFTDRAFAGSPLAVVPDASGLSTDAMRAISAELHTLETSFVFPPTAPGVSYRLRVFTPGTEMGGGGHASIGTAATLVRLGAVPAGTVVQECHRVRQLLSADATGATLIGSEPLPELDVDAAAACSAVGLSVADVVGPVARSVGFGARFPVLPVGTAAVDRAEPDFDAMRANGFPALFVFAWDATMCAARARLFAPGFGIDEDPACGPAALALGLFLVGAGWLPASDGVHRYAVRQGRASGRTGVVNCTVSLRAGQPVGGTATGLVAVAARGRVRNPDRPEPDPDGPEVPGAGMSSGGGHAVRRATQTGEEGAC